HAEEHRRRTKHREGTERPEYDKQKMHADIGTVSVHETAVRHHGRHLRHDHPGELTGEPRGARRYVPGPPAHDFSWALAMVASSMRRMAFATSRIALSGFWAKDGDFSLSGPSMSRLATPWATDQSSAIIVSPPSSLGKPAFTQSITISGKWRKAMSAEQSAS